MNMNNWYNLSLCILIIRIVFILFFVLLFVSEQFRNLWFSWFYTKFCTPLLVRGSETIRPKLFQKLARIFSENCSQHKVILAIGPAQGNNFEYFPPKSRMIALDNNEYFKKYFLENKSKFPHIMCEKFITGIAEDMREINDQSVDVVVATFLLCSVKDRDKTLKEIKRVLKKGGTYFFMEHVGYPHTSIKHLLLFTIQLVIQPLWYALAGGCHIYRHSWHHIQKAGFENLELHFAYPKEKIFHLRAHIWGTATM